MAAELPYLPTYKNVERLFQKIAAAKQPEAFTQRVLATVIGLTSAGDRSLIPLLKTLGFLDSGGRPTVAYAALKNPKQAPRAIAAGIRRAYEPLFAANENAHSLPPDELKGLVAQVAGSDTGMTAKIVGTLNSLIKLADFTGDEGTDDDEVEEEQADESETDSSDGKAKGGRKHTGSFHPAFHYNIQVHLPANGSEETYLNIFNALRRSFE